MTITVSQGFTNPGYVSAHSSTAQQLYTVSLMPPITYTSPGTTVTLTTATADTSIGNNVVLYANGNIALIGNITYQLGASTNLNNANFVTNPLLQWYDVTNSAAIGLPNNLNETLIAVYTPTANATIICKAIAPTAFLYPATLTGTILTVQVIDNYVTTVANI